MQQKVPPRGPCEASKWDFASNTGIGDDGSGGLYAHIGAHKRRGYSSSPRQYCSMISRSSSMPWPDSDEVTMMFSAGTLS